MDKTAARTRAPACSRTRFMNAAMKKARGGQPGLLTQFW